MWCLFPSFGPHPYNVMARAGVQAGVGGAGREFNDLGAPGAVSRYLISMYVNKMQGYIFALLGRLMYYISKYMVNLNVVHSEY